MLICLNRSFSTDIPVDIRIDHFSGRALADVQTLSGSSINDANDADKPNRGVPVRTQEALHTGVLRHIFPRESVTVITIHLGE